MNKRVVSTPIRLCLAGPSKVGKTSLITSYVTNAYPTDPFVPSVIPDSTVDTMVDGKPVEVTIRDSNGHKDYERLMVVSFIGQEVFLLCFSVASRASFDEGRNRGGMTAIFRCCEGRRSRARPPSTRCTGWPRGPPSFSSDCRSTFRRRPGNQRRGGSGVREGVGGGGVHGMLRPHLQEPQASL